MRIAACEVWSVQQIFDYAHGKITEIENTNRVGEVAVVSLTFLKNVYILAHDYEKACKVIEKNQANIDGADIMRGMGL